MSSPNPAFKIQYALPGRRQVTNDEVDSWELKASRRALKNLRTLLVGQPMVDLVRPQVEAADAFYRSVIATSNGEYQESRIDASVQGLAVSDFLQWHTDWLKQLNTPQDKEAFYLQVMMPAHPEHYYLPEYPVGITETIGGHIARVRLHNDTALPESVLAYADPSYKPVHFVGSLASGETLFYVLQEFKDVEDGAHFILRLLFPASAPQIFFDEHAEHLAIEFRSFMTAAFESKQARLQGEA